MMNEITSQHCYWNLPFEEKIAIAEEIKRDNLDQVNQQNGPVEARRTFYSVYVKRFLDIVISGIALVVALPINLVLLVGTYFDVGRPILFHQKRIGRNGTVFVMSKFRNMINACNSDGILLPPSERVTKWGHFVRKTSLDELLNFWYILKGDMSVIGPRPMPDEYSGRFSARHDSRHLVRPGLECPLHDPAITEMTWENRFENDIWYIQNISLKTDLMMLVLLAKDALFGRRRGTRAEASIGCFMGYDKSGKIIDSEHIPEKYYLALQEERQGEKECTYLSR